MSKLSNVRNKIDLLSNLTHFTSLKTKITNLNRMLPYANAMIHAVSLVLVKIGRLDPKP